MKVGRTEVSKDFQLDLIDLCTLAAKEQSDNITIVLDYEDHGVLEATITFKVK